MKLIIKGKVYVEIEDLVFIGNLPNYITEEITQNKIGIELFKNPRSIDYFTKKYEIIDYNNVKWLSEEKLYDIIHAIYEECFKIEMNYPKSVNNILKLEKYEYMVRTLKKYIDYRKLIDKKFYNVSKGELEWQIKRRTLKKD